MDYIRWYNDGKFGKPEKFDSDSNINNNIFKIGDTVKVINNPRYIDGNIWRLSISIKVGMILIITDVKKVNEPDVYLIKLKNRKNWYDAKSFEKI